MVIEEPTFEENVRGEEGSKENLEERLKGKYGGFIDDALKLRGFELERAIDEKLDRLLLESRELVKDSKTFYQAIQSVLEEILIEAGAGERQILDKAVEHIRENDLLKQYLPVRDRIKLFFFTLLGMRERAGEMYRSVAQEFLDDSLKKMDELVDSVSRRIYSQRDNLKKLEGEMDSIRGEMKRLIKEFAEIQRDYDSLKKVYEQHAKEEQKTGKLTIADILRTDHVSSLRTKGSLTELEFLHRSAYNKLVGLRNRYLRLAVEHALNLHVLYALLRVYEETKTRRETYSQLMNNRTSISSIQDLHGLLQRYESTLTSLEQIFSGYDASKVDVAKFGEKLYGLNESAIEEISQEDLYLSSAGTEGIEDLMKKTRELLGAEPSQLLEEFGEGGENDESQ